MKRNMNLIRTLLQKVEQCDSPHGLDEMPEVEGHSGDEISYHFMLLVDAGLVKAEPIDEMGAGHTDFVYINLTWEGQDFLDATKDDTIWKKANEFILKPGVSFTFGLLRQWLEMKAKEKLGIA